MAGKDARTGDKLPVWRKILRVIAILVGAVAVLFFYLLLTDSSMDTMAKEWFASPRTVTIPADENAFFLTAGFAVPDSMDPVKTAETWAHAENERIAGKPDSTTTMPQDAIFKEIRDLTKQVGFKANLDTLAANAARIEKLYSRAGFLTSRYETLARMTHFETTLTPYSGSNLPNIVPVLQYKKLRDDWILTLYRRGRRKEALSLLRTDIHFDHQLEGEVDFILFKLACSVFYIRDLRYVVNTLLNMDTQPSPELLQFVNSMEPLSAAERSMRKALHYEGWMAYNRLVGFGGIQSGQDRSFAKRALARKNTTANLIADSYGNVADLTEMNGPDYMKARSQKQPKTGLFAMARSLAGAMQAETAWDFLKYADALYYDNGYLVLLKAKAAILEEGIARDQVAEYLKENQDRFSNVFTGKALQWDADDGDIFFTGPYSKENKEISRIHIEFPESN